MQKKESYNFAIKAKYRQLWKEFIHQRIPNKRKARERLQVACFPGHEGLEVLEVYDRLGIPRSNIVGIEGNPGSADELKSLDLGIEVYNGDAVDFFASTSRKFHIVNLDYQGYMGLDASTTIGLLVGRPVLQDRALVGTNFLRKREHDSGEMYKRVLLGNAELSVAANSILDDYVIGKDPRDCSVQKAKKQLEAIAHLVQKSELKEYAEDAITQGLVGMFNMGSIQVNIPEMARAMAAATQDPRTDGVVREFDAEEDPRKRNHLLASAEFTSFYAAVIANIVTDLTNNSNAPIEYAKPLAQIFFDSMIGTYHVRSHASGKYVSEKRAPMVFDFFEVSNLRKYREKVKMQWALEGQKFGVYFDRTKTGLDHIRALWKAGDYNSGIGINLQPRIFIGSDAKGRTQDVDVLVDKQHLDPSPSIEEIVDTATTTQIGFLPTSVSMVEPVPVQYDISSKADLYLALDLAFEEGELPDLKRVEYLLNTFSIAPNYQSGLAAKIAHWTMKRNLSDKPIVESIPSQRSSFATNENFHYLAAVASRYGNSVASSLFNVNERSVPAIKAQVAMGKYPDYDAAIIEDAVFIGLRRDRELPSLVIALSKEHGGIDKIPSSILQQYKIEQVF